MKIIVTGSSGLIGNSIINSLSKDDYSILALFHSVEPVINVHKNIELLKLDLTCGNLNPLSDFKPDCLIHCAAKIPSNLSTEEFTLTAKINRKIDEAVIGFCRDYNIKLIYFSSISVYENNIPPYRESDFVLPSNDYSIEKLNTELKIADNINDYIIFRVSSPYGEFQKNRNVLKLFVEKAKCHQEIQLYSGGRRQQDFIHVEDISAAISKAIHLKNINSVFNLAFGKTISMRNLAQIIIASYKSNSKIVYKELEDINPNYNPVIDISKAKAILHWQPSVFLDMGLRDFLN